MDVVTKEHALKIVLAGACRMPEVGKNISTFSTSDLIWAENTGLFKSESKKLPLWVRSGSGSGSGTGSGNGYTSGGISLALNSTDFDVNTEDDTNDRALIQIRDLVWTASGGPIPSSGVGARWLYLSDDNGTESLRQIVAAWDFGSAYSVSTGQTITVQNAEIRVA